MLYLALPHFFDRPTELLQFGPILGISFAVPFDLFVPESEIGFGKFSDAAAVPVPKASMHKNCFASALENYVGFSRQILPVEAKSVAKAV